MSRRTKAEIQIENEELRSKLEQVHDDLCDFLGIEEDDSNKYDADEDRD